MSLTNDPVCEYYIKMYIEYTPSNTTVMAQYVYNMPIVVYIFINITLI